MPPVPDAAALERYVEEAAQTLGIPIDPAWRPAVAEHLPRLLEAAEAIDATGLAAADHATRFEP